MPDESDGIEEALAGVVRLTVTAGARLGSELARAREARLRELRRTDEREASRLADRFEAEKRVTAAELAQVHQADWWECADPARIGQTYATARAWAPAAPEAAHAERKMREEVLARYGVDIDRIDPRSVNAEVEGWRQRLEEQRRHDADRQRTTETAERAEASTLLDQAAREDRRGDASRDDQRAEATVGNPWLDLDQRRDGEAEELQVRAAEDRGSASDSETRGEQAAAKANQVYDSAERRAADARAMEARGVNPEVAQSRMRADTGRAQPATLATAQAGRSRAPKARKTVSRGAQAERAGVER